MEGSSSQFKYWSVYYSFLYVKILDGSLSTDHPGITVISI